jgi:hypothetical protein
MNQKLFAIINCLFLLVCFTLAPATQATTATKVFIEPINKRQLLTFLNRHRLSVYVTTASKSISSSCGILSHTSELPQIAKGDSINITLKYSPKESTPWWAGGDYTQIYAQLPAEEEVNDYKVHHTVEAIRIGFGADLLTETPFCHVTIKYVEEREEKMRALAKGAGRKTPFDDADIKTAEER